MRLGSWIAFGRPFRLSRPPKHYIATAAELLRELCLSLFFAEENIEGDGPCGRKGNKNTFRNSDTEIAQRKRRPRDIRLELGGARLECDPRSDRVPKE